MPDSDSKLKADEVVRQKLAILGRLTATIAHDVRNPLGTINTSIFSIKTAIKKNQPERIEKAIMLAERNVARCDSILAEFIDITQEIDICTIPVNIDAWIRGFIEELVVPSSIECVYDLNCDSAVPIDPDNLRRALACVVKNAFQAMKDCNSAQNKLTISSSISEDSISICVSDTGPGISDDVFPKIFDPLFSTKRFGVGLGLTVTREIVEKHKGTIVIESETGSGTKVTMKIPAAPPE